MIKYILRKRHKGTELENIQASFHETYCFMALPAISRVEC